MTNKEIRTIRNKLKLSQSEFALVLSIPLRTLPDWEQGRRKPSAAAITLLKKYTRIAND
jgi:putative transcriptional regulator